MMIMTIILMFVVVIVATFFMGLAVGVRGLTNVIAKAIEEADISDELRVYLLEKLIKNPKS